MKSEWAITGTARWISLFRRKPIELFVRLSPSDEVMQLRADVAHLEERLKQLRITVMPALKVRFKPSMAQLEEAEQAGRRWVEQIAGK